MVLPRSPKHRIRMGTLGRAFWADLSHILVELHRCGAEGLTVDSVFGCILNLVRHGQANYVFSLE